MEKKRTVFVTGATGLVGSYLTKVLLEEKYKVFVLARNKNTKSAKERVIDILNFWDKKTLAKYSDNLNVFEGDITKENLGLSNESRKVLKDKVEEIFHCAAVTAFNWPLDKIRKVNVEGTKNVLCLANECNSDGKLRKVNHISTVYVFSGSRGVFAEENNPVPAPSMSYVQSKIEAEKIVEQYRGKNLWTDIFRLPFVVGESKTGATTNFGQLLYQLLHIWNLELFEIFPGKDISFYVVSVDDLANAIIAINKFGSKKNMNYHPFCEQPVALEKILNISSVFLKYQPPRLISFDELQGCSFTSAQNAILSYNAYLLAHTKFGLDSKKTMNVLAKCGVKIGEFNKTRILRMLKYSLKKGFLKKHTKEKTYG